jgi:hypothetical protein
MVLLMDKTADRVEGRSWLGQENTAALQRIGVFLAATPQRRAVQELLVSRGLS